MGHYSPVFFFLIDKQKLPQDLHSLDEANLDKIWDEAHYGIWTVTSRNWSYQFALHLICEELKIFGLEFIVSESACLDDQGLKAASTAIEKLLLEIAGRIPTLSNNRNKDPIWWLHETPFGEKFSSDVYRRAFSEAQISYDVDDSNADGYGSVVGFYSFLKSLQNALLEAIDTNRGLYTTGDGCRRPPNHLEEGDSDELHLV